MDRYRLRAERLRLHLDGSAVVFSGDARAALCPCPDPPLTFLASGGRFEPPGDLVLRYPRLAVAGVPVFALPWLWLRAPDQIGILPPLVAVRGGDGLLLGSGVHLPWRGAGGALEGVDLLAGGYVKGGAEVGAHLVTAGSDTRVTADLVQGTRVAVEGRGTLLAEGPRGVGVAWTLGAIRGDRARSGTVDLSAAARPFDTAAAEVSWRAEAGPVSAVVAGGAVARASRGEGPIAAGPRATLALGGPIGALGSWSADASRRRARRREPRARRAGPAARARLRGRRDRRSARAVRAPRRPLRARPAGRRRRARRPLDRDRRRGAGGPRAALRALVRRGRARRGAARTLDHTLALAPLRGGFAARPLLRTHRRGRAARLVDRGDRPLHGARPLRRAGAAPRRARGRDRRAPTPASRAGRDGAAPRPARRRRAARGGRASRPRRWASSRARRGRRPSESTRGRRADRPRARRGPDRALAAPRRGGAGGSRRRRRRAPSPRARGGRWPAAISPTSPPRAGPAAPRSRSRGRAPSAPRCAPTSISTRARSSPCAGWPSTATPAAAWGSASWPRTGPGAMGSTWRSPST